MRRASVRHEGVFRLFCNLPSPLNMDQSREECFWRGEWNLLGLYMAEGEGFEPPVPAKVQRFSRPKNGVEQACALACIILNKIYYMQQIHDPNLMHCFAGSCTKNHLQVSPKYSGF